MGVPRLPAAGALLGPSDFTRDVELLEFISGGAPGRKQAAEDLPAFTESMLWYLSAEAPKIKNPLWARELYAGVAGLTRALQCAGIPCRPGVEVQPDRWRRTSAHDLGIEI